jgi:hypothetical protein
VDAFNEVHVVWIDGRQGVQRVLYSSQVPGGGWSPAQTLSVGGFLPEDVTMDADGLGGVHIVWADRGMSEQERFSFDLLYLRIDPETMVIPDPVRLIDHSGVALRPFLEALDDGTLHLVWLDDRSAARTSVFEIYYKRYLPGIGWGNDKRFTYDGVDHNRPVIVAGAGNTLNLAWEDFRAGTPDIYYRQITQETGWDRDLTPLTSDISASQAPSLLAISDGRLIIFWTDSQGSGTFQVFAKDGNVGAMP